VEVSRTDIVIIIIIINVLIKVTLNVNTLQGHFTQSIVKLADAASHGAGRTGENRSS